MFNSKKIKRLSDENEELKTTIETIHGKEENIKNLNLVLKKMRLEVAELNEEKRTIRESIGQIKNQEESKKIEIVDLSRKIEHLREMKDELQNVVLSYTNKIENIESTIKRNQEDVLHSPKSRKEIEQIESNNLSLYQEHSEIEQNLNDALTKTNQLNDEEKMFLDRKENSTSEIIKLGGRLKDLNISYEEISNKLKIGNERINFLKTEESRIKTEIVKKQNEIFEVEKKLLKLKGEERALLGKIENLSSEENTKLNTVRELDSVLAEKEEFKNSLETEHSSLMNDINEKRNLLLQTQEEFDKLSVDLKIQSKELFDTEQTLNLKARKLSNINIEILNYEKKYESLKIEVTDLEKARKAIFIVSHFDLANLYKAKFLNSKTDFEYIENKINSFFYILSFL